ncbi:MAG: hypothetical protein NTW30_04895 [Candidatus Aenigmarchaeota archaeon]|nr:hypothetical protein [Candidatus Aenigmarchaeota archaeon]
MIPNSKEEYLKMMGIDQKDYGSKEVIKRDVKSYFKKKGYKEKVSHLSMSQLKAITKTHII